MANQKLHRGRLIDHVHLVVGDLEKSYQFYKSVSDTLKISDVVKQDEFFYCDEIFVSVKDSKAAQGKLTGRVHLAFQAADKAMVEKFYAVGLENGGKDNGKPGERPYHPGYYAAFLIDPDGNNIEAVFHGPAKRSSPSVEITF